MRKILFAASIAFSLACLAPVSAALADDVLNPPVTPPPVERGTGMHRIGLGVNYWTALKNLDQDVHSDGFSYVLSYQYAPVWFVKVGTNVEYFPYLGSSSKPFLAPELMLTVGGLVYAGAGIGIYYHDSDWGSAPFYMLRAGLDIPVLPRLFLDLNINYRFNDWKTLNFADDLNTETLHLGAAVRFVL